MRAMLAAAILLAGIVNARGDPEQAVCAEHAAIADMLRQGLRQFLLARGVERHGLLLELFASADGTWTLVQTNPNGVSCVVTSGEAWQSMQQGI